MITNFISIKNLFSVSIVSKVKVISKYDKIMNYSQHNYDLGIKQTNARIKHSKTDANILLAPHNQAKRSLKH